MLLALWSGFWTWGDTTPPTVFIFLRGMNSDLVVDELNAYVTDDFGGLIFVY